VICSTFNDLSESKRLLLDSEKLSRYSELYSESNEVFDWCLLRLPSIGRNSLFIIYMEEFQRIGDALAQSINEGNIDEALKLIHEAVNLDAEFEVFCDQKANMVVEEQKNEFIQEKVKDKEPKGVSNSEIYEKLIEMGVDRDKALALAGKCKNINEAINSAFS